MKLNFAVPTFALATVLGLVQAVPPAYNDTQWQLVDQICGYLEFETPKKTTIVVNGKTETRLYSNPVKDADVLVYRGTASDKTCCVDTLLASRTHSNRFGEFEFSGFQNGWYWLRVKKGGFSATIPLHVTRDFDAKSCRDRSVERIFTVDAQSPKVQTRIH
jgi:hypothetical protein